MPVHDWTRVNSGLFHDFHQSWSVVIKNALNSGSMPEGYYALVEQRVDGPEPDVIAVQTQRGTSTDRGGATATLAPPQAKLTAELTSEAYAYANRANRISIRHPLGTVVAVIEIVSPGNKDSKHALRSFVEKAVEFLRNGIHLLIIDLFPPSPRDPQGIHKAIWDEFSEQPFTLPTDTPLTLVSYHAGESLRAYIEPIGVGQNLPNMPLFLRREHYISVPLEPTYATTWNSTPMPIQQLVLA